MSVEVRQPSGTATIDGESFPPALIQITTAVGGPPTAMVRLHARVNAAERAARILSADIARSLGVSQNRLFAARPNPNAVLRLSDGAGGNMTFEGYVSNPAFSLGVGSVGFNYTIQHASAVLSAYKSSIYENYVIGPGKSWEPAPLTKYMETLGTEIRYPEVSRRIKACHELLLRRWDQALSGPNSVFDVAVKKGIHKVNEYVKPFWFAVLDASNESTTWDSLGKLGNEDNEIQKSAQITLNSFIINTLMQNTPNFFGTIEAFCQAFQMLWVPTIGERAFGKFIRFKDVVSSDPKELRIPVKSAGLNGGNRGILPVTHAVVRGPYDVGHMEGTGNPNAPIQAVCVWPATVYAGGQITSDSGPPWIGRYYMVPTGTQEALTKLLSLDRYQASQVKLNETVGKAAASKQPILEEWARNNYIFASLASATATIPIPMDLSIQPGTCYRVSNKNGDHLFTGFLAQVAHTLDTESTQPVAETILSFTHMEAAGFTFPNKS